MEFLNENGTLIASGTIGVLLTACAGLLRVAYADIVRRLDEIKAQTVDLPSIRKQVSINTKNIEKLLG